MDTTLEAFQTALTSQGAHCTLTYDGRLKGQEYALTIYSTGGDKVDVWTGPSIQGLINAFAGLYLEWFAAE